MTARCTSRAPLRLARWALVPVAITTASLTACSAAPSGDATAVRFVEVARGLDRPVHLAAPRGDPRLFVVEQPGRVRIIKDGALLERPFLDLRASIRLGSERGLLSIAFHPGYRTNGLFFVNYTDREGDTQIVRYRVSDDPDVADRASAKTILSIEQPYSNHNGGLCVFGPDGMLYIGTGDGGAANDPQGNGQNRASWLGKMLRIDVDHGDPYAIPRDNPFVDTPGVRPEIWALGLRNPWRFAFDPDDELLYIGDVGQNRYEEIDVTPAGAAGLNFGWNIREGLHCLLRGDCLSEGLTDPALEYPHPEGCSVTGGLVYRGRAIPALVGHYVYGDYCAGWIRSFRYQDGRASDAQEWRPPRDLAITSFGTDGAGELYVLSQDGRIYRFAAGS